MITIGTLKNAQVGQQDEIWAIVRSLKVKPAYVKQVVELSPETTLFYQYLDWKKKGIWGKHIFLTEYVPAFIEQLTRTKDLVQEKIKELIQKSKSGMHIHLVCFCDDESLCHRSIIIGYLQYLGYGDEIQCDTDYSFYFK